MKRSIGENGMIISDLTDARILAALADRDSFASAARALGLPPATLSRRVSVMEDRAGLRLFERSSRTVQITEAGTVAARQAQAMVHAAEAADLDIDGLRTGPSGQIRLSAPVIFGQALLAPAIAGFLDTHPDCSVTVDLSDRHVDLINERFDVVVRIGPPENDDIIVKPLGVVHASLYQRVGDGRFILADHYDALQEKLGGARMKDSASSLSMEER